MGFSFYSHLSDSEGTLSGRFLNVILTADSLGTAKELTRRRKKGRDNAVHSLTSSVVKAKLAEAVVKVLEGWRVRKEHPYFELCEGIELSEGVVGSEGVREAVEKGVGKGKGTDDGGSK